MFKSTFAKYLTSFTVIIIISFIILSVIITSILRTYTESEREVTLERTSYAVAKQVEKREIENLDAYAMSGNLSMIVSPLVNRDRDIDIFVTDADGNILLSTLGHYDSDGRKLPSTADGLGKLDFSSFEETEGDGVTYLFGRKVLDGKVPGRYLMYAKEIVTGGQVRGYCVTLASTANEDELILMTRKVVITSSLWVMLASIVAIYFITERIVHPLRTMTDAAKRFAKGNFDARVPVTGSDEVSELGRAFNHMADSLDNLEKMRNSFLANVSHDLRTPMTTISGFIDNINSGAIPQEKVPYYLGVISAEVHRLSRLVGQILDVSRLESGDRKFTFTDFDVAEVARLILISFEQQIDEKHLDVGFESEEDEMVAYADKDAIYQVIYNLCHNAIKFAKEGGKFIIRLYRENKKIVVSVYDEGHAVPKEDLPFIFERFYKSDKSRGLDKTGVGLGLYISKTIIDAHGEDMQVFSEEDKNYCEFRFTLKEGDPAKVERNRRDIR